MTAAVFAASARAASARWSPARGEDWRAHARCTVDAAPAMDTTSLSQARQLIRGYCSRCPVTAQCREEAETIAELGSAYRAPEGVWGGQLWHQGRPVTEPLPDR